MTHDMHTWLANWPENARRKDKAGLDVTREGPWLYTGDMNLECGGMFFKPVDEFGTIRGVEVRPDSDRGGPDNVFHVQDGYLFAGDPDEWQSSLDVCGYTLELVPGVDGGHYAIVDGMGAFHDVRTPEGATLLADAVNGAKGFDDRQETVIQIGKGVAAYDPEPTCTPDTVLRGNKRLHNYIRENFL